MTTCRGNHNLIVIYRDGSEMEENVVRWCQQCGAVTVDVDVDGRTQPGGHTKMQLPLVEKARQGVLEIW